MPLCLHGIKELESSHDNDSAGLISPESFLGPEYTEHHVMFHHIKVPGDYGAFVRVLNENLVYLK